jgi:hypothetical protein
MAELANMGFDVSIERIGGHSWWRVRYGDEALNRPQNGTRIRFHRKDGE